MNKQSKSDEQAELLGLAAKGGRRRPAGEPAGAWRRRAVAALASTLAGAWQKNQAAMLHSRQTVRTAEVRELLRNFLEHPQRRLSGDAYEETVAFLQMQIEQDCPDLK